MRIVGDGFLARNLAESFGDRFPAVTALACGVSRTTTAEAAEYDREAQVLYDTLDTCAREGRQVLFFSTSSFAMYGFTDEGRQASESYPVRPPNTYGRHKLALESVVRSSGVEYLVLRLSHAVGGHQRPHQLLPTLVRNIGAGEVTVLRGAHRDLLDVRDLMHAVGRLLADGVSGEVLNVASGIPQPVESVVTAIEQRLGVTARRVERPGPRAVTRVSLERLRRFVPDFRSTPDEKYLDALLDAYLPYCAGLVGD
ncbi:NAD dependent epimerase/dehydratase family protein [Streptomyces sp. DI166]|uniref:NAD-dependent epimerase/dehydratase family protein n=1 Tax=Streptomyces sp. DI166 TaxID=1839783 RepID=UPI0007F44192|nr:NAD-dependent epimerase/dehydratase family protein [Streptomyces sp. DI166]SBT95691.1 NAD dependent epimerase/dehydratase family protein [Streptomyces sp. DI166]